jgi:membrane protein YqaA with SNARE-associated domain
VLTWLLVTFAVAVGSALFPPLSIELFAVALAVRHPHYPPLLFGAVIAVGQVGGKLVYYYAALGKLRLPAFLHKRTVGSAMRQPAVDGSGLMWQLRMIRHRLTGGLRAGWTWLRIKCHRHPRVMLAALAASSVFGVPPFLATTILAGLAGVSLRDFVLGSLPGRFVRFTAIMAAPMLLKHWVNWGHLLHPHFFH